jgi:hypothetical protein
MSYIEAYLATKERALAKLGPPEGSIPRFKPADSVLAFLDPHHAEWTFARSAAVCSLAVLRMIRNST